MISSSLPSSNTSSPVFDLLSTNHNSNDGQGKYLNESFSNATNLNDNRMLFSTENNFCSNNDNDENIDSAMFSSGHNNFIIDSLNEDYSLSKNNQPMIINNRSMQMTLAQLNGTAGIKDDEALIDNWPKINNGELDLICDTNLFDCENFSEFVQRQKKPINERKKFSTRTLNAGIVPADYLHNSFNLNLLDDVNGSEVIDDTSLEIESYFHQPYIVNNLQTLSTDTSNNLNNLYIIQENPSSLPPISYSSPDSNGQSGLLPIDNNEQPVFAKDNVLLMEKDATNLVSKSTDSEFNPDKIENMNYQKLNTLISSPVDNTSFNLPSNPMANTTTNLQTIQLTTTRNNNRLRNNSMSTDISSHDEGFASQPEDDFDDYSDNSSELINSNNREVDNDIFFLDNNQNGISTVSTSNDNIGQPTIISMPSFSNDHNLNSVKSNAKNADVWMQNNVSTKNTRQKASSDTLSLNKSSNLSTIDENEESDDDDESFLADYDNSDLIGASISDDIQNKWSLNMGRSRKGSDKRYFWQYNVQSKGPKGPRMGSGSFDEDDDPHVFNEISDPVFAPDCQVEGVKHSGKARRGDGNDLTANPKKLLKIGLELKKLSKIINELTPVTDLPFPCRNKSRKEKNKLASRACRLKKKAQHEANKIKLFGLHREHGRLVKNINHIRQFIDMGIKLKESHHSFSIDANNFPYTAKSNTESNSNPLMQNIEIAGKTADFVNLILDNVTLGIPDGGLKNY